MSVSAGTAVGTSGFIFSGPPEYGDHTPPIAYVTGANPFCFTSSSACARASRRRRTMSSACSSVTCPRLTRRFT